MICHTSTRSSPARRAVFTGASALLVLAVGTACTGEPDAPERQPAASRTGTDAGAVTTVVTLRGVGRGMAETKREAVKQGVTAAIDPWLDTGFLGNFPRTDYSAAFAGFTPDAAADAQGRDLALLTNQSFGEEIDEATATKRRVQLEVFAAKGHARGATARVVLDFDTTGEMQSSQRVRAQLYLVKDKGQWRVFGYDVDQAATL